MNALEFIEKVKVESSLDIDTLKCMKHITEEARKVAKDGCVCVDDDTVREWILKFAEMPVEEKKTEKHEEKEPDSEQLRLF